MDAVMSVGFCPFGAAMLGFAAFGIRQEAFGAVFLVLGLLVW